MKLFTTAYIKSLDGQMKIAYKEIKGAYKEKNKREK